MTVDGPDGLRCIYGRGGEGERARRMEWPRLLTGGKAAAVGKAHSVERGATM